MTIHDLKPGRRWRLICSVDAVGIDYETILEDDNEPHWTTCQTIAEAHGCTWWTLEEVTNE